MWNNDIPQYQNIKYLNFFITPHIGSYRYRPIPMVLLRYISKYQPEYVFILVTTDLLWRYDQHLAGAYHSNVSSSNSPINHTQQNLLTISYKNAAEILRNINAEYNNDNTRVTWWYEGCINAVCNVPLPIVAR